MTKTDTHTKAQVSNYDTPSRRRITHCGWILRNKTFLRNKWRIDSAPGLLLSREGVVPRGYIAQTERPNYAELGKNPL